MGIKQLGFATGVFCLIAACSLVSRPAAAADRVKLLAGATSTGKITSVTPTSVTIELGSKPKKHAVNEIDVVQFDSEPSDLTNARSAVRAGRYEDAEKLLDKIDTEGLKRAELSHDVAFYKALVAARLALAGSGSKSDAGKKLVGFERAHPKSFHYFETCEALGDLLADLGKPGQAEGYYAKLGEAPWPDYKVRAAVLAGRALVAQKQYDQARAKFEEALKVEGSGKEIERQKLAASLGNAAALAGSGKSAEAIETVEKIIDQAEPENSELMARAYNILGNCYLAAGQKQDAVIAFLHVDWLYSRQTDQHAEALSHLAKLWTELNKSDRANLARNTLKEKYPGSAWAK